MDELIAFLAARLDEDEAAAKAWASPPWREDATHWQVVGQREPRYDNGRGETLTVIDVSGRPVDFAEAIQVRWDSNGERAEHIARHDPARVLADVAADRALLTALSEAAKADLGITGEPYDAGWCEALELAVKIRAARFADHPDYRQEWKP
jgi:hypothetical protein